MNCFFGHHGYVGQLNSKKNQQDPQTMASTPALCNQQEAPELNAFLALYNPSLALSH